MLSPSACILLAPLAVVVVVSAIVRVLARSYYVYDVPAAEKRNAIVITGCDSGIGKEAAVSLVEGGFTVIASTFTKEGRERLEQECSPLCGQVICQEVDITQQSSVESFRARVESLEEEKGLRVVGLVNNAGAAWSGPIEFQPVSEFNQQIQVNLVGHVRMCHEFIAIIRRSRGRIVNIASVAGLVGLPSMGAYCASKYGIEAVSDTLRAELRKFGISVSVIEPGWVQTPLVEGTVERFDETWARLGDEARELYDFEYRFERNYLPVALRQGISASQVTKAIVHALTSPTPKTRYQVGLTSWLPYYMKMVFPTRVFDTLLHWAMIPISARRVRQDKQ